MKDLNISNGIGIVTISTSGERYLESPEFIALDEFTQWINHNSLKGIVICGSGRHFSGGAEIENLFRMAEKDGMMQSKITRGKEILQSIEDMGIPVIAAINGVCFGGGLEIALACHIRVCSPSSLFAFPETNLGLIPGLGGTVRAPAKTSLKDSLSLILGGDMINAGEALAMKLVDVVTNEEDSKSYAVKFLERITSGLRVDVVNCVMKTLKNYQELTHDQAMKEETKMFCQLAHNEFIRRKHQPAS